MKIILAVFAALLFSGASRAQTVSPIAQEFSKKADGDFIVSNDGLAPLAITVEPKSFSMVNGQQVFRPLDAGVDVRLSETAFKLGPKAQHRVGVKIRCNALPCAVLIFSNFSPIKHADSGFDLAYHLPVVFYTCRAQRHCRKETLAGMGYSLDAKK